MHLLIVSLLFSYKKTTTKKLWFTTIKIVNDYFSSMGSICSWSSMLKGGTPTLMPPSVL